MPYFYTDDNGNNHRIIKGYVGRKGVAKKCYELSYEEDFTISSIALLQSSLPINAQKTYNFNDRVNYVSRKSDGQDCLYSYDKNLIQTTYSYYYTSSLYSDPPGVGIVDNKLIFAGAVVSSSVSGYTFYINTDTLVKSSEIERFSKARCRSTGGENDNYAIFVGGFIEYGVYPTYCRYVDAYNKELVLTALQDYPVSSNGSSANGSISDTSSCTFNNKAVFIGGYGGRVSSSYSPNTYNRIATYDNNLIVSSYTFPKSCHNVNITTFNDKIICAGYEYAVYGTYTTTYGAKNIYIYNKDMTYSILPFWFLQSITTNQSSYSVGSIGITQVQNKYAILADGNRFYNGSSSKTTQQNLSQVTVLNQNCVDITSQINIPELPAECSQLVGGSIGDNAVFANTSNAYAFTLHRSYNNW